MISPGVVAAALALPVAAVAAPTVDVEKACWNSRSSIDVAGTGYRPGVGFRLLVNGEVVVRGTTTTTGDVAGGIRLPPRHPRQRPAHVRAATDRRPAQRDDQDLRDGDLGRLRARGVQPHAARHLLFGNGFGPRRTRVYLHYVSPKGKVRRTVRLGRAVGACGSLQEPGRRVLPFTPVAGRWRLQFDTRARYVRGPRPSVVLAISIIKRRSTAK